MFVLKDKLVLGSYQQLFVADTIVDTIISCAKYPTYSNGTIIYQDEENRIMSFDGFTSTKVLTSDGIHAQSSDHRYSYVYYEGIAYRLSEDMLYSFLYLAIRSDGNIYVYHHQPYGNELFRYDVITKLTETVYYTCDHIVNLDNMLVVFHDDQIDIVTNDDRIVNCGYYKYEHFTDYCVVLLPSIGNNVRSYAPSLTDIMITCSDEET